MIMHGTPPELQHTSAPAEVHLVTPEQSAMLDRRSSIRHRTVRRIVKLAREGGETLTQLCNISDEGLMVALDDDAEPGEPLTIELSRHHRVTGRIAWAEDGLCGVKLDQPIDSFNLLHDLAEEQKRPGYRPARLDVKMLGVAYSELGLHPIRATNLSLKGMGVTHDGRFRQGLRLLVVLENGVERRGVIRWTHEHSAGLLLSEPLACADINRCAFRLPGC